LLRVGFEKNLILNHVSILISRNPSGSSPQNSLIIDFVVALSASHNDELVGRALFGITLVSELVHMIVNDLAQVDECALV
jgi:hypothetical protein